MRRPRTGRPRSTLCLTSLAVLALSGCSTEGLAFRVDDRLQIVAPQDSSTVTLPVTVEWSVEDFEVVEPGADAATGSARDSGSFAVFVDRAPQPPGETVRWVARDDRSCRAEQGCPDPEYLAAQGVYTTTETSMTFEQFPQPPADSRRTERHSVTIVLLDADGERIGESAFQVDFSVNRTSL